MPLACSARPMKTSLIYGAIMAVAGAVFTLLMFFAGFHDSPEKMKLGQWLGMVGGLAIGVVCLALAMRAHREQRRPDQSWGYASAFGIGVLTSLVAALLGSITGFLYFAVINPGFSEVIYQMQVEKMEAAGVSAAQMERIEPMVRKWTAPGILVVSQVLSGFMMGVVLSLIVAIFFRRRTSDVAAPMPPPLTT